MSWTNNQLNAINHGGHNIIVSAGAGSGKTTVLKERVLKKLNEGININELLILTFTNASAKDMKEKIKKVIKQNGLKEQEELLDASYISTFDSFSLSLVKKYHYVLGLDKSISLVDSNIIEFEQRKILDCIFDDLYDKEDSDFLLLIKSFVLKDDKELKNSIISMNNKIALKYNKYEYLNDYINKISSQNYKNNLINSYRLCLQNKIEELKDIYDELLSLSDADYVDKLDNSPFSRLFYEDLSLDELLPLIRDFSLPNLPRNSNDELKECKKLLMDAINKLKKSLVSSTSSLIDQLDATQPYINSIVKILIKLNKEIDDLKRKNNCYEFSDIAMFAIKLVKENENIKNELKYSFKEIMVDEYQDTSDLQEMFIQEIANDNVYTVGDIKQAIYGFRNANPELFRYKYDNYRKGLGGEKIDLTDNFRSRKEVVDFINIIFSSTMSDDIGGASYKDSHLMIYGNKDYENVNDDDYNSEVLSYFNILEEYKDKFTPCEIEAFIIAKDIKEKVKSGFCVYDNGNKRLCKYSDFAILIDKGSDFETFKKIFDYLKVPLFIDKDKNLTNSYDVNTIANIIRLIVKEKRNEFDTESKYLFTSIARSFLFDDDDDRIFSFYKNNNFYEHEIFIKCKLLSSYIDICSPSEMFDLIVKEFDMFNKVSKIGNVEEFMIRIEEIHNMCESLDLVGNDIYYISDYLQSLLEDEKDIRYKASVDNGKSVTIMTIHNSKGLEYRICYFAGLNHLFNIKEITSRFIYDNEYGFITPYYNDGVNDTFIKFLLQEREIKNIVSEKIRLFYVALTRAKEKAIIVTGNDFSKAKDFNDMVPLSTRVKYRSFDNIILSVYFRISKYVREINDISLSEEYKYTNIKNVFEYLHKGSPLDVKDLDINFKIKDNKHYSKSISSLISKDEYEYLQNGNDIHEILECIDFINPNLDIVDEKYKNIVRDFLNSDLLNNLSDATIYKEFKFIYDDTVGMIDLMIERANSIDIIDYKFKNIDDEDYASQLKEYRKYISTLSNKEIHLYLYSLVNRKYKEIK